MKDPKGEAGKRTGAIPPHRIPALEGHLAEHVAPAKDALLFPSRNDPIEHMTHSTLNRCGCALAPRRDGMTLPSTTSATREPFSRPPHAQPSPS